MALVIPIRLLPNIMLDVFKIYQYDTNDIGEKFQ